MRAYKRGKVYWVSYTDTDGKQRRTSTRCTDYAAACLVGKRLERDAQDPTGANAAAHTLDDALGALLEDRAAEGKAKGTVTMYRQKAAQLVRVLGNLTPLERIDADAVDAYKKRRKTEGVAPGTIEKELVTLRMAMKLARRRELFRFDPAVVVKPVGSSYQPRERVVDEGDVPELLARLPDRVRPLVAFCLATGARLGEAARACRSDVSADGAYITLRGTKTKASRRAIPVPRHCAALLAMALEGGAEGSGPLFKRGASVVHYHLTEATEALGWPRLSPNDLRRSFATWLYRRGVAPHVIARMLGHASTAMVDRVYARHTAGDLASLLGPAGPAGPASVHPVYTPKGTPRETTGDNGA